VNRQGEGVGCAFHVTRVRDAATPQTTTTDERADAMASTARKPGEDVTAEELSAFTKNLLEQMQGRFQTMSDAIITKIDDMQAKIDELERSVNEIASEAGKGASEGKK
jgi:heat shock factor-binding protein 1